MHLPRHWSMPGLGRPDLNPRETEEGKVKALTEEVGHELNPFLTRVWSLFLHQNLKNELETLFLHAYLPFVFRHINNSEAKRQKPSSSFSLADEETT